MLRGGEEGEEGEGEEWEEGELHFGGGEVGGVEGCRFVGMEEIGLGVLLEDVRGAMTMVRALF